MTLPVQTVFLEKRQGEKASISVLQKEDVKDILALRDAAAKECAPDIYSPSTEQEIQDCLQSGLVLGIRQAAGKLIACALIRLDRPSQYAQALGYGAAKAAKVCDIDDIIVDLDYRGNQLQALLLQLAEALCEEQGKEELMLSVSPAHRISLRNVEQQRFLTQGIHALHGGQARYILKKGIGTQRARRAYILIDYTYDFVAEDGKLTAAPAALAIEDAVASCLRQAGERGESLYVVNDIHHEGDTEHPESKLFPPHNLAGTAGRELYGKVKNAVDEVEAAGAQQVIRMDKTRYSAFAHTDLAQRLHQQGVTELQLLGVCTDICVLHTAVDAYNLGFDIVVDEATVASFNAQGHELILQHLANSMGATVIPA